MRLRIILLGVVVPALVMAPFDSRHLASDVALAQDRQPDEQLPRFRAGANLVRVDTYITKDGTPVTDLKAEDFAVFEDDKPQRIENFELIEARAPVPQSERVDPNNTRDMRQ